MEQYDSLKKAVDQGAISSIVQELAENSDGLQDLDIHLRKLEAIKSSVQKALKTNVYQNYPFFIDTAEEMKKLEADLIKLHHLLADQKLLLSDIEKGLGNVSTSPAIRGGSAVDSEGSSKMSVNTRLSIEVSAYDMVPHDDARGLELEEDVQEVDINTGRNRQFLRLFLLTDGLLIVSRAPENSTFKYDYVDFHDLETFSAEDIKPAGNMKNVLKFVLFPDPMLVRFKTAELKKNWLTGLDRTKKKARLSKGAIGSATPGSNGGAGAATESSDLFIYDIPAHLDVSIALRDYEASLRYLQQADSYFKQQESVKADVSLGRVKTNISQRKEMLVKKLLEELSSHPSQSQAPGRRNGQQKAVAILVQLGHRNEACQLYLKSATLAIRRILKVKLDSRTERLALLCSLFFSYLINMKDDFQRLFSDYPASFCALSVWCCEEVGSFCALLRKFLSGRRRASELEEVAEVAESLSCHHSTLKEHGMDMSYQLSEGCRAFFSEAVQSSCAHVIQVLKDKSSVADNWRALRFETNKAELVLLIKDLESLFIPLTTIESLIEGDTFLLSNLFLSFIKSVIPISAHVGVICAFDASVEAELHVTSVIDYFLDTAVARMQDAADEDEKMFIVNQLQFLVEVVFRLVVGAMSSPRFSLDPQTTRIRNVSSTLSFEA